MYTLVCMFLDQVHRPQRQDLKYLAIGLTLMAKDCWPQVDNLCLGCWAETEAEGRHHSDGLSNPKYRFQCSEAHVELQG